MAPPAFTFAALASASSFFSAILPIATIISAASAS